MNVVIRVLGQA